MGPSGRWWPPSFELDWMGELREEELWVEGWISEWEEVKAKWAEEVTDHNERGAKEEEEEEEQGGGVTQTEYK